MKIICMASWKGGTGKTTLAVSAITTLAKQGKKVLAIDLDSNLSMTRVFGMAGKTPNSIDLLNGEKVKSYSKDGNIFVIPSNLRVSRMTNLSDGVLKKALKTLDLSKYDYVFIDPPGTMNALTRNAIKCADKIIIPAMPSNIDFEATGLIFEEMSEMEIESDVSIILNGWDSKRNTDWAVEKFNSEYSEYMTVICMPAMKSLKNLTAKVFNYDLKGIAKNHVENFVREVIG